jgi:hypothetical protein
VSPLCVCICAAFFCIICVSCYLHAMRIICGVKSQYQQSHCNLFVVVVPFDMRVSVCRGFVSSLCVCGDRLAAAAFLSSVLCGGTYMWSKCSLNSILIVCLFVFCLHQSTERSFFFFLTILFWLTFSLEHHLAVAVACQFVDQECESLFVCLCFFTRNFSSRKRFLRGSFCGFSFFILVRPWFGDQGLLATEISSRSSKIVFWIWTKSLRSVLYGMFPSSIELCSFCSSGAFVKLYRSRLVNILLCRAIAIYISKNCRWSLRIH